MNTFHVSNDALRLPTGDLVTFEHIDEEPIAGIAKILPGHTWRGYRGDLEIVRHGSTMRVMVACGIILGRWSGHSSAKLTFRQAEDADKNDLPWYTTDDAGTETGADQ